MNHQTIKIRTLEYGDDGGIDVCGDYGRILYNVPRNLVRCAIGEEDMEYLLNSETWEEGFSVLRTEWEEMIREEKG